MRRIFGKTLSEEADEAAEERSMPDPEPELVERSSHPQDVAQRSRTEQENAELAEQLRRQAAPVPLYASASGSIHEELAALERSLGRGTRVPGVQPRQRPRVFVPIHHLPEGSGGTFERCPLLSHADKQRIGHRRDGLHHVLDHRPPSDEVTRLVFSKTTALAAGEDETGEIAWSAHLR